MIDGRDEATRLLRTWMERTSPRVFQGWREYVRASGLTVAQFSALMILSDGQATTIGAVSKQLEISGPAASQLVDRLVRGGYITRTEDPDDRRTRQLALTEQGRTLVRESLDERFSWIEPLAESLSDDALAAIATAFPALMQAFETLAAD